MALAGAFLRTTLTVLRVFEFLAAGIVLGIFSYFLAVLADRNAPIAVQTKVIEGISGIACVYAAFAVLLTCCLGGKKFFAFLAMVLDACFVAGFIVIAILTRGGASTCTGNVNTPLGSGSSTSKNGYGGGGGRNVTYSMTLGNACRMQTAVFAVALLNAIFFIITLFAQLSLARRAAKDKRYGPSPSNNYTSGTKFSWRRKRRSTMDPASHHHVAPTTADYRMSTDAASSVEAKEPVYADTGYGNHHTSGFGHTGGHYHTGHNSTVAPAQVYNPHATHTTANF